MYAHVATDPGYPGQLALQYWFFYPFNDFNNTHEGDWEMTQLVFDAADATEALTKDPSKVGYSSHEGAEGADWGDEKLELVDGTHPVVYPAAGSHANKFTAALYLGSSADAGVGCDNTVGPHRELTPIVRTIPSDPAAATAAFPWITFEGRWGELQAAFFNGPTGPNMKDQWLHPIEWSQDWRDRGYAVPAAGVFGTGATDLFCNGVAKGSKALVLLLRSPGLTLLVLGTILGLLVFAAVRATWRPVAPLRLARRRSWGQIISASGAMYVRRPRLFLGIGVLLIPLTIVITLLQWLVFRLVDLVGTLTGQGAGTFAFIALVIGATLTLLGLGLVQAATACALVEIDAGRPIGPVDAYRISLRRFRPLLRSIALFVLVWLVLTTTAVPDPGGDLARRALVPARACRRARRSQGPLRPPPQRQPRPRPLDPHRLARRRQRGHRARPRAAPRRGADLRVEHALRAAEHRRGCRLRPGAPVRRPRHGLRLLRRPHPRRARARAAVRAAGRDRARSLT